MQDGIDNSEIEPADEIRMPRIGKPYVKGLGHRVWQFQQPLWFVDWKGRRWILPMYFSCDLWSSPRPFWIIRPPSDGDSDAAAGMHDFLVRCRTLLGIGLRECHHIFRDAMKEVGIGRVRRNAKYLSVYCFNWLAAGDGRGYHSDDRYNNPVGEELEPIDEWVMRHYRPDGKGHICGDS